MKNESLIEHAIKKLLIRSIFSYLVFYMVYVIITTILDRKELGNFDPSGHLLCALTSYANWFQFF